MKSLKKITIKIVAIMLVVIITTISMPVFAFATNSSSPPAYVVSSSDKALWAEGTLADTTNNIDAVKWYKKDGTYYWFLPSSANLSNLTVYHNFDDVKINGISIVSGNSYSIFENGQNYSVTADGATYDLCVQKASGIGSIFLTTESGSIRKINSNKSHRESGELVAIDYDGSVSYDNKLDYIKGRGHSTWSLPKKPYNIKLDKKTALFGMDKNKSWCLLANAQDHSMIRNKLMYDLADEVGLEFSPDSRFVDLYANGQYLGTYQITQKVEAGDGDLVDITDLEGKTEEAVSLGTGIEDVDLEDLYSNDIYNSANGNRTAFNIPYNPDDITGGYLIEFVMTIDEPSSFITKRGQPVNVKAPEYCTVEQIDYIADFMQELEDAVYSSTGYNSLGKHYTEYIDIKSAAIMYLLHEFSVNIDGGKSSCYFYKDSNLTGDGKVHAAPCWDFDVTLGNLDGYNMEGHSTKDYDNWFTSSSYLYPENRTIFAQLCTHIEFSEKVEELWKENFVPALSIAMGEKEGTGRLQSIYDYKALLENSSVMNYTRWNLKDTLLVPESGLTYNEQFEYLETFIKGRTNFISSYYSDVDGAKKGTITLLYNLIARYEDKCSEEAIAEMTAIADQAKIDINNATKVSQVSFLGENAKEAIMNIKVSRVYFDNSKTKWSNVYAYTLDIYSGIEDVPWPGIKMTHIGNDIYSFDYNGIVDYAFYNIYKR